MTKLKPLDKVSSWKSETRLERLRNCASMLYVHQFLTDREQERVQKRLVKWISRHGVFLKGRRPDRTRS